MSGHTPSPWLVEETEDGHQIRMGEAITNRRRHAAHLVVDYDHMVDPDDGDGSQYEEAAANARLMGAAAELLEALAAADVQRDPRHRVSMLVNDWQRIEAAMAKAEGRQP